MFKVIGKQNLSHTVRRIDIRADELVTRLKPGHFVAVAIDEKSRRLPFGVFDIDWRRKCLSIIFEETDDLTRRLGAMKLDDDIFMVSGPFGVPVSVEKKGTVICVGEGLGLTSLVMLCRSLKQVGNKVIGIAGFESRKSSLLENQMRLNCGKFFVMYQDGMHDRRGDVLDPFKKIIAGEKVERVYVDASLASAESIARAAAEKGVTVIYNIMSLIEARPSFDEAGFVLVNGERYFPAVDGVFVDAGKIPPGVAARAAEGLKEYTECRRKEQASARRLSVWARFKKFIWG